MNTLIIILFIMVIIALVVRYKAERHRRHMTNLIFRAKLSEGDVFRTANYTVHQVATIHDDLVLFYENGKGRILHINDVFPIEY
ncbi:MAG TPA: hypothetical protein PKE03_10365 [Bacteroidales bacterium]|nr:hypothetical protein [Bacteroidales bacterium]